MGIDERIIISGLMGSHSVGTNTVESDVDFMQVVLASDDVYLGLDWWGDQGTKQGALIDNKETTAYEIRKFLRLCQNFNPNVIPLLWLKNEFYQILEPAGFLIIGNRHLFNSRIAYHAFSGYAYNQLKKMGEFGAATGKMGAKRKALRDQFGYDTKYAYHTIRLGRMLIEFLESSGTKLNVYRKDIDADFLMNIRNGKYTYDEILEMSHELLETAKLKLEKTDLPEAPDKKGIRDMCKIILADHLGIQKGFDEDQWLNDARFEPISETNI